MLSSAREGVWTLRTADENGFYKNLKETRVAMTVVSRKGQVVIPREIRERHGWRAGTELEIVEHGDSIVIRALKDVPRTTLDDVLGCLHYRGPAKTIAEMDAAFARPARRRGGT